MNSSSLPDIDTLTPISASSGCLIAVSGGADSVALLHGLHGWAVRSGRGVRLEVLHVHHQLRGAEADEDARFVEEMSRALGLPFHLRRTAPPSSRPRGVTLEEFLRAERHGCFEEVLEAADLKVLALGHTADDLAETFLMHLLRGAGLRGLSFSPTEARGGRTWVRPLWRTSRSQIEAWLARQQIPHREDATNASPDFTRNRVRSLLLPLLEREFNPSVRQALRRSAEALSGAEDFVRTAAREQLEALVGRSGDRRVLPREAFLRLHPFLQREVAAEWVRAATEETVRPGFDQIEALVRAVGQGRGRVDLPGGFSAAGGPEDLVMVRTSPADPERDARRALALRHLAENPGVPLAELPPEGIRADAMEPGGVFRCEVLLLDGTRRTLEFSLASGGEEGKSCPPQVILRNRRPGDRVSASAKLKEMLINDKVPAAVRDYLILAVTPEGRVIHVLGIDRVNARLRRGERRKRTTEDTESTEDEA